jgi:transcriptional regulator with XRE-family HTH domain
MATSRDIVQTEKRFADRVRLLRVERDWSQEELAAKAGIHRTHVGFIERAERTPGLDVLAKLAAALEMSISELVAGIDEK